MRENVFINDPPHLRSSDVAVLLNDPRQPVMGDYLHTIRLWRRRLNRGLSSLDALDDAARLITRLVDLIGVGIANGGPDLLAIPGP